MRFANCVKVCPSAGNTGKVKEVAKNGHLSLRGSNSGFIWNCSCLLWALGSCAIEANERPPLRSNGQLIPIHSQSSHPNSSHSHSLNLSIQISHQITRRNSFKISYSSVEFQFEFDAARLACEIPIGPAKLSLSLFIRIFAGLQMATKHETELFTIWKRNDYDQE